MSAIQLEFNIKEETDLEMKIRHMELQVACIEESFGKVRRKLFSQIGEIEKRCVALDIENQNLKSILTGKNYDNSPWIYGQNGRLFSFLGEEIS